ncbi:uncharacterized protein NECHADRAFT_85324 [Fusarium vanettenii 77-13-4]|uniref:Clr5 domain-containing protein n=1 Tax=Fusarium vanettenii (strain ATCC MYA-4622 / CBS 123669 / FGSC 9596 / NRRL 45880 / 77-13-4) TaxID=660122 RepID=C7ZJ13_FUSV7|nr:uncharacterized protein NECHADRAFT_85324 [Fusarium vanettenii 77-13-4]EEU35995.1 hypothetical protein NECHADRAFT_85324 [Fusarium vanettenii 77-13-4]
MCRGHTPIFPTNGSSRKSKTYPKEQNRQHCKQQVLPHLLRHKHLPRHGPISWPNFGTEAFASGPEWPSAPMETTYMPQNPWTGALPQWMPEELSRMTINEPSLQLPHTLEPPDIMDLDYQNPMQAHSSGTTYPFFTVGDGVEFEGVVSQPTPRIPSLTCTVQNPQPIPQSEIPRRSAQQNPGVSSYSDEAWEAIRPIFRDLFITQRCTLPQTSMIRELVHHFTATKKRHWPDCVKNKTTATGTNSQILSHQVPGSSQSQTRPKKAISTLIRKHDAIPNPTDETPVALNRPERADTLKAIIGNLLHDKVFNKAQDPARFSSPNQLSLIWDICRILQGLCLQLRHRDTSYVESFIHSLQDISSVAGKTHHVGMTALLESLLGISPCDLQDTMRISFLCTARALSSRLGPATQQSWNLGRHMLGLEETEQKFGLCHDYTINLLRNYASAAHYIFHDNELARDLAKRLWERTWSAYGNDETTLSWSVKAQGMAEAAKMRALLCCINHENKRKSNGEMKRFRRKMKLKGRKARRRFRATLESPPDPRNAKQAIDYLEKTVGRLDSSEWDCKFVKAGLLDILGGLKLEFCPKEVQGAAKSHREEGKGIRLEIATNELRVGTMDI